MNHIKKTGVANDAAKSFADDVFQNTADIGVLEKLSLFFGNLEVSVDSVLETPNTSHETYDAFFTIKAHHYCCTFRLVLGEEIVILQLILLEDEEFLDATIGIAPGVHEQEFKEFENLTMFLI